MVRPSQKGLDEACTYFFITYYRTLVPEAAPLHLGLEEAPRSLKLSLLSNSPYLKHFIKHPESEIQLNKT